MEELRSLIPLTLEGMIYGSTSEDTPSTCSELIHYLANLSQFQRVIRELTSEDTALCAKSMPSALDSKRKGNEFFSIGDYNQALRFYTEALRFAPTRDDVIEKITVATIYINRATCLHKMGLLVECIRDCDRAIVLAPTYSKAWYRRGQANASLGHYKDAMHNLNVALSMESSLPRRKQIEGGMESMIGHANAEVHNRSHFCSRDQDMYLDAGAFDDLRRLRCVMTPEKGREVILSSDIPPSSLVVLEQPYAAVILKKFRETHCHFCFNELPADVIPCSSCTIPLYCSICCHDEASGNDSVNHHINYIQHANLPPEIERYITEILLGWQKSIGSVDKIPEHKHECGGAFTQLFPPVRRGKTGFAHLFYCPWPLPSALVHF